jgi:large subunit ribosomal protein L7/L12
MPVEKIVEELNKLSVLELVELKKSLEEAWDVSAAAAAPVMVAAPGGAGGGGGGT